MSSLAVGDMLRFFRAVAATLISGLLSILLIVLLGIVLPMSTMMLIYGRQAVQDAPAHAGIILFLTVPLVGYGALVFFYFFAIVVHKRLSRNRLTQDTSLQH